MTANLVHAAALELERRRCERSLLYFARCAWPIIEPKSPYIHGRHVDAICLHLEAMTRGDVRDLVVNIPPRHMKSSLVAVLWPAWVWTFRPESRWLFASYAADLSTRDSMKRRRIIESSWYRTLWPGVSLVSDLNLKTWFQNAATGYMLATSVGGRGTGEGGDVLVADDPNQASDAHSKTRRAEVVRWWDEEMSTRGNNPETFCRLVVQQRIHEEDLTGHLKSQRGWEHLCLPAEYETAQAPTSIGWRDWRTEPGELLWPERFDADWIDRQKGILGAYAYAGQFQQRPAPADGGMIKRAWLKHWTATPGETAQDFAARLGLQCFQSWDTTQKASAASDFTVGQVWGVKWPAIYLLDQVRARMDVPDVLRAVESLSAKWPAATLKLIEEQSSGFAVLQLLRQKLTGLVAVKPQGSKEARLQAVSPLLEAGNVYLPPPSLAPFVNDWVEEVVVFPNGAHDDQCDALSQALSRASMMRGAPPISAQPPTPTRAAAIIQGKGWRRGSH